MNQANTAPVEMPPVEDVNLEWSAPSRPFQARSKEYFRTVIYLVLLVAIILIFMGEFLLIGVILATFFVFYALSTVPPENITNKINSLGIETAGYFHKWEELHEFWFDKQYNQEMVVIKTYLGFPTHLRLILSGEASHDKIKEILSPRLPYREIPEHTFLDRASAWLARKIPLEKAR